MTMSGAVYLVGAGPGAPGLITARGAELLRKADVVVYDRLVSSAVLALAANAELVYVGKEPDTPASSRRSSMSGSWRPRRQGRRWFD